MPITLVNQTWDRGSGTRERLALLAAIGPSLDPQCWGYHPTRDFWYYCGGAREIQGRVQVSHLPQAEESLTALATQWSIDKETARDLIRVEGEGDR